MDCELNQSPPTVGILRLPTDPSKRGRWCPLPSERRWARVTWETLEFTHWCFWLSGLFWTSRPRERSLLLPVSCLRSWQVSERGQKWYRSWDKKVQFYDSLFCEFPSNCLCLEVARVLGINQCKAFFLLRGLNGQVGTSNGLSRTQAV